MRRWPIRLKITAWFTAVVLVFVLFSYFTVFYVHQRIEQKMIRDNLIEAVENNVDEVEFYDTIDHINLNNETDYFSKYQDGYLEIDDDFLEQVNHVFTALYHSDRTFLYGKNPISNATETLEFADSKIQTVMLNDTVFYVFDRKLETRGVEDLWLRGVVSEAQGMEDMAGLTRFTLFLLPILVLISIAGGYFLTRKMLDPIREISKSVAEIGTGRDLGKRIEIGEGKDELHQLADSFNKMCMRLEEAFETERQFTDDASHELRTPISVITAQCEFSLEEPRSSAEYEYAIQTILRQSRRMSKLINDMLAFTRFERQAENYVSETVDLTELVKSVCFDMALIQTNGIHLEYEAEESIVFHGNRQLLSRILINLIHNAYQYGKENGRIIVRLSSQEHEIVLSVSDDGIGIAKEEQPKIFRRFYQSDPSRSAGSAGLGLSMVQGIAQFYGGSVSVESELGHGSTFIVIFQIK